ncbi:MAG: GNAT family N-acetyltransferase [Bacteroidota bacterium]
MERTVEIIGFEPTYSHHFTELNLEWIKHYFKVEEQDLMMLNDPVAYIIDKGGEIFFARVDGEIVGTCALIKNPDGSYELSKMAVSPKYQGLKLGWKLGKAVVDKARELGGTSIWLESNTILTPAIRLYEKLGFVEVPDFVSPYERANIKMEIVFE